MGLVGGPHCLAMCAAPCHVLIQGHAQTVHLRGKASNSLPAWSWSAAQFHVGRLVGYALLGGIAALAMERVAWFSDRTSLLHPIWVLMHLAIFAWGLLMLFQGQQPAWLERAGKSVWLRAQPLLSLRSGAWLAGVAWALMPCGLLYSAMLVAALSGAALSGAASMIAFGLGSALWLLLAPFAWHWLRGRVSRWRAEWGMRAAGLMLIGVSLWALWMDLIYQPSLWCR